MNPFIDTISEALDEMETLISEDNLSYEQDERLQDLYNETERNIEEAYEYDKYYLSENQKDYKKLKKLQKRFKHLCKEFETPDDLISGTLEMMYPNEDE